MVTFGPKEWGGWSRPGWQPGEETKQEYTAWLKGGEPMAVTTDLAVRQTTPYSTMQPQRVDIPVTPVPGAIVPVNGEAGYPAGRQQALDIPALALGALSLAGRALLAGDGQGLSTEEAFLDYFGLGYGGREGKVAPTRTTAGTGAMAAGTFRAWDPIQQGYYGILDIQGQAFMGMTFAPGNNVPGGSVITKAWVTHATRKDNSLATTQFAMTADGRMHSLSETGIMKSWRPYKSIVIGKTLTSRNLKKVARRVKSHVKSLKGILSVLR